MTPGGMSIDNMAGDKVLDHAPTKKATVRRMRKKKECSQDSGAAAQFSFAVVCGFAVVCAFSYVFVVPFLPCCSGQETATPDKKGTEPGPEDGGENAPGGQQPGGKQDAGICGKDWWLVAGGSAAVVVLVVAVAGFGYQCGCCGPNGAFPNGSQPTSGPPVEEPSPPPVSVGKREQYDPPTAAEFSEKREQLGPAGDPSQRAALECAKRILSLDPSDAYYGARFGGDPVLGLGKKFRGDASLDTADTKACGIVDSHIDLDHTDVGEASQLGQIYLAFFLRGGFKAAQPELLSGVAGSGTSDFPEIHEVCRAAYETGNVTGDERPLVLFQTGNGPITLTICSEYGQEVAIPVEYRSIGALCRRSGDADPFLKVAMMTATAITYVSEKKGPDAPAPEYFLDFRGEDNTRVHVRMGVPSNWTVDDTKLVLTAVARDLGDLPGGRKSGRCVGNQKIFHGDANDKGRGQWTGMAVGKMKLT